MCLWHLALFSLLFDLSSNLIFENFIRGIVKIFNEYVPQVISNDLVAFIQFWISRMFVCKALRQAYWEAYWEAYWVTNSDVVVILTTVKEMLL